MRLSTGEIEHFAHHGFVRLDGAIDHGAIDRVTGAIEGWIDSRAVRLAREGALARLHRELDFAHRYTKLHEQNDEFGMGMDIMHSRLPEVFAFLSNDGLLESVASLIGPEITVSPIQHIRAKTPITSTEGRRDYVNQRNVPWHQDAGVLWEEADHVPILTCWIPLVDVTVEMGCMEIIPGVHRGGYLRHQAEGETTILPELLPGITPVPLPCPKGSLIIMDKFTPHRGMTNHSDLIRWSMDLRYQPNLTPTGRPFHPAFVLRSSTLPVTTSFEEWTRAWKEALAASVGEPMHREQAKAVAGRSSRGL